MSISDHKIMESDYVGKDVAGLPDNPSESGIGAPTLKERFDSLTKNVTAPKHNALIETLAGTGGAGEIGTTDGTNVQGRLDTLNTEKIPKSDIVQMRGRSETQIMSQKAVTDAIDAGGGGGGGTGDALPIGTIQEFGGATLPDGYLWCDGASYPANGVYKKLFDIVGTAYNQSGDTAGTFRVPDMRGRVGVGRDEGTFDTLGGKGGEEKVKLTSGQSGVAPHKHNISYPSGNDGVVLARQGGTGGSIGASTGVQLSTGIISLTNAVAANAAETHENMPPYLVCNYIIKFDRSYEQIGVTAPPVIWEIRQEDWQVHAPGGYVLNIPENEHRRGQHCVLTALYDMSEAGKLKAMLFEMEKNEAGDITIYSDTAFDGKAYIDRVYMVPAGRVLSVNGQTPDVDGDVAITEVENAAKLDGKDKNHYESALVKVGLTNNVPLTVNVAVNPVPFDKIYVNTTNAADNAILVSGKIKAPAGYRYAEIDAHIALHLTDTGATAWDKALSCSILVNAGNYLSVPSPVTNPNCHLHIITPVAENDLIYISATNKNGLAQNSIFPASYVTHMTVRFFN